MADTKNKEKNFNEQKEDQIKRPQKEEAEKHAEPKESEIQEQNRQQT